MPRGSVGAPWGGDTPPSVTAQGDWGTKQGRQGEGAAALGEGCSSGHVVAAAEGEIFHLQPCSECGHCKESLDPAWGFSCRAAPLFWAMLRRECCWHRAG